MKSNSQFAAEPVRVGDSHSPRLTASRRRRRLGCAVAFGLPLNESVAGLPDLRDGRSGAVPHRRPHAPCAEAGTPSVPPTALHPRGLSLLEVILAIAVLGGCMAVIGELVRMGVRNAEEARELTKAQLLCESKLEEVAAGIMPLESAANAAFELAPDWSYTIETGSLDQQGLVQVRVTVQQVESDRLYPLTFTLTRWIVDPSLASGETSTDSPTEGQTETSGSSNDAP